MLRKNATTLVIIDMQTGFSAANAPETIAAVVHQVKLAKRRQAGIVVAEYDFDEREDSPVFGKTHNKIIEAIGNYKHVEFLIKRSDDGSKEIVEALRRKQFNQKRIRLCGVNTRCCVLATAAGYPPHNSGGLLSKLSKSKIEVEFDACNCTESDSKYWVGIYPIFKNLIIRSSRKEHENESHENLRFRKIKNK